MTPRLSAAIPVPKPHKPHHHKSFTNQQRLQSHHTELTSNNNNHDIKHHLAGDTTPTSGPPFPGEAQLSPTTLALAGRLQSELRAAKSRHLACTEVLLPSTLLNHVASEMVSMAELEPCGIRGCCVYIEFEDEPGNSRYILSSQNQYAYKTLAVCVAINTCCVNHKHLIHDKQTYRSAIKKTIV